jgi:hypothetical protein
VKTKKEFHLRESITCEAKLSRDCLHIDVASYTGEGFIVNSSDPAFTQSREQLAKRAERWKEIDGKLVCPACYMAIFEDRRRVEE